MTQFIDRREKTTLQLCETENEIALHKRVKQCTFLWIQNGPKKPNEFKIF